MGLFDAIVDAIFRQARLPSDPPRTASPRRTCLDTAERVQPPTSFYGEAPTEALAGLPRPDNVRSGYERFLSIADDVRAT